MSEAQRRLRDRYEKNRKRLILIQAVIVGALILLTVISSVTYGYIAKSHYMAYTEDSHVDYTVKLKDNAFYEDDYLGEDHTYVATLIDSIYASFEYELDAKANKVDYDYAYRVEAQLLITSTQSEEPIYDPIYVLKPEQRYEHNVENPLRIQHAVMLDYDEYNDIADRFMTEYEPPNAKSCLMVRMYVTVYGAPLDGEETTNEHVVELQIPLTEKTVDVQITELGTPHEVHQIARNDGAAEIVFMVLTIVFASLSLLGALFMIAFVLLTRTHDTTYAGRLSRLLNSYKSYIRRTQNLFDKDGYQVILVDAFADLLEIRETIQSPILMYENEDRTRSEFVVPGNEKLLYLYVLQVEDYEERYAPEEPVVEEPVVEEPVVEEPVVEEPEIIVAVEPEPEPEPVVEEEEGVEVIDVIWPEHKDREKERVYRYDPNGEQLEAGDIVLVPSTDIHSNKELIREAEVAKGNYKADPDTIRHPLKKIIRVVRRRAEKVFTSMIMNENASEAAEEESQKGANDAK